MDFQISKKEVKGKDEKQECRIPLGHVRHAAFSCMFHGSFLSFQTYYSRKMKFAHVQNEMFFTGFGPLAYNAFDRIMGRKTR